MSQKISARTAASTLTGAEILPVVQGGADRRVTLALAAGDYVTPEKYGAVGDGVTDDTTAFQAALDTGARGVFAKNIYLTSTVLSLKNDQIIFGLPKSKKPAASVTNEPRIKFRPAAANKVCVKNTAGTTGGGVQDLAFDLNDNSHTGIQFSATYANVAMRCHFYGTMRLGLLSDDTYECTYHDLGFQGASVRTACLFIGTSNAMSIERLNTSTAPETTSECLYGIVMNHGISNSIRDCVMQGVTIGVASDDVVSLVVENLYTENILCGIRHGYATTGGSLTVNGGTFFEAGSGHSQYSSRGPYGLMLGGGHASLYGLQFGTVADNASSPYAWPVVLTGDGTNPLQLHVSNPKQYGGSHPTRMRDLFYREASGVNTGFSMIGSSFSSGGDDAQEIILKSSGDFGTACRAIRIDSAGALTSSSTYQPAVCAASINSLLTTATPTGASLVL